MVESPADMPVCAVSGVSAREREQQSIIAHSELSISTSLSAPAKSNKCGKWLLCRPRLNIPRDGKPCVPRSLHDLFVSLYQYWIKIRSHQVLQDCSGAPAWYRFQGCQPPPPASRLPPMVLVKTNDSVQSDAKKFAKKTEDFSRHVRAYAVCRSPPWGTLPPHRTDRLGGVRSSLSHTCSPGFKSVHGSTAISAPK